jgi:hypothetical protein
MIKVAKLGNLFKSSFNVPNVHFVHMVDANILIIAQLVLVSP